MSTIRSNKPLDISINGTPLLIVSSSKVDIPVSLIQGNSTNIASGVGSHAEGVGTQAIGSYSHAEGLTTITGFKGYLSTDVGLTTPGVIYLDLSYGDVTTEFTIGGYIILDDSNYGLNYYTLKLKIANVSVGVGPQTVITLVDTSISITTSAIIGVFGVNAPTGADMTATAAYSHAEGKSTKAIGYNSHAEGQNTQAIGLNSHAEGQYTQAIGQSSHAEGLSTLAIGVASHAEGGDTQAIGTYSHAGGLGTVASGSGQFVVGQYNAPNNTTDLFIVGGGTVGSGKDVFTVSTSSVTISGSVNISGSLLVNGQTPGGGSTVSKGFVIAMATAM